MKNLFKLSTFILLLCSFVFGTTSIVSADEKKAEDAAVADTDKAKEGDEADKKKKKKKKGEDEEEPECE